MSEVLKAVIAELQKDKYLAFFLVLILLYAFMHTKNEALLQLLVAAVGVMAGLLRSGAITQNVASGEGAIVKTEPPAEVKA